MEEKKYQQSLFPEALRIKLPSPLPFVKTLAGFGPRPTGGKAEKRASLWVKDTLKNLGLPVYEEVFRCNVSMFRPHILVFFFVVSMSALPILLQHFSIGFLLAAVGCIYARKMYTDILHNKPLTLTKILPKKECRNILGKLKPQKDLRNRIVLLCHADSAICSPIFGEKMVRNLRTNIVIDRVLFALLGGLYFASLLTGYELPYYLALGLSFYVLGSLFVLIYSELFSPPSPGVNDNATGVGTVLTMAAYLKHHPLEHTEIWFVCLGAEESGATGSKIFYKKYAEDLKHSYIVNLNSVGVGNLRYFTNEGYIEEYPSDAEMTQILAELSIKKPNWNVKPFIFKNWGGYTDCTYLLQKGCRGITLVATEDDGFIKNWHTLKDTLNFIQEDTLHRALQVTNHLIQTLDKRSVDLGLVPGFESKNRLLKKPQPRVLIVRDRILQKRNFKLKELLWENFDKQAGYVFHTTKYLESQCLSLNVKNGFIILEEAPKKPIAMVPYFVYYELIDDGAAPSWMRNFARKVKFILLNYEFPIFPGFKTLFLGTPFGQPSNQIYLREDLTLEDILQNEQLLKSFRVGIKKLQLRFLAANVSFFNFERTLENDRLLRHMGFSPFSTWPDMYLDFKKIRTKIKNRHYDTMQEAKEHVQQTKDKLIELKRQEKEILHSLESDPLIKERALEKHLRLDAEERLLLEAAEAQNQIDDLTESLKSGKYIEVLNKKVETNYLQRNEAYPYFRKLSRKVRRLIGEVFDQEEILHDAQKQQKRSFRNLQRCKERLKNLVERSLLNKYQGIVPNGLDFRIKFFLEKGEEINPRASLSTEWVDISMEDLQRRLDDLRMCNDDRDRQSLSLKQFSEKINDLDEKRNSLFEELKHSYGGNLDEDFDNLSKAYRRNKEIKVLKKRIEIENKYFSILKLPLKKKNIDTPERSKLQKAIQGAEDRRIQAIRSLGIVKAWVQIPERTRANLKTLADVHLQIRKTPVRNAEKILKKARIRYEQYDDTLWPTFDDYVESLGNNERQTMKRNLERIRATEKNYQIEIIKDDKQMQELIDDLYRAYETQYRTTKVQWLKIKADYFRHLVDVPGVEIVVCWHFVGLNERKFAGFIINLGSQFNHRMGINDEYKKSNGKGDDDHLIYFRLTLKNIEENLKSKKPGMWIAQTTYEAKRRMGFEIYPLVSYRRPAKVLGFPFLANLAYQKSVGNVSRGDGLFKY